MRPPALPLSVPPPPALPLPSSLHPTLPFALLAPFLPRPLSRSTYLNTFPLPVCFSCYMDVNQRTKKTINTFRLYLDVDRIWYWQIIALVIGYLALKRYERVKYGTD